MDHDGVRGMECSCQVAAAAHTLLIVVEQLSETVAWSSDRAACAALLQLLAHALPHLQRWTIEIQRVFVLYKLQGDRNAWANEDAVLTFFDNEECAFFEHEYTVNLGPPCCLT
jgi:hypothetical protein